MPPAKPVPSPSPLATLWWSWLGAPAWWLAQFESRYALMPWACRQGHRWVVLGVGVIALLGSVALAGRAWRVCRKRKDTSLPAFLALGGAGLATLFALLVVAQLLPDFLIDPCRL